MSESARPLLVLADDWGRHPSSCQHLVRHLLPHRPVLWVNTIGTRPPRLDWGTVKRGWEKVKSWASTPSSRVRLAPRAVGGPSEDRSRSEPNTHAPQVLSPRMWPSFRSGFGRRLNKRLLLKAIWPVVASMSQPPVVVTTLPLVADLVGELPAARWVYYCVDDFSVWPGYDGDIMLRMERDLVPKMDAVIAVSETLQQHVARLGKSAHLLTHGVDLAHWANPIAEVPPEFAGLESPIVLFWGVIDRRMDVSFVKHLSASLRAGTVVLVGPREDPDPALLAIPRVVARPPVPYSRLPVLAQAAAVLVMPYADIPATRAMQPLKLKEYLATGRPTVMRALPSTLAWADACDVCGSAAEFAAAVSLRVTEGASAGQRAARGRLASDGWDVKAGQFEKWVNG